MEHHQLINRRKLDHIELCLNENVKGQETTTGFERFHFIHQALPEINFSEVNLKTEFLNKKLKAPFLISSMTGGTEKAFSINKNLAEAAQEKGWALGLGSARAAIENSDQALTFHIRKYAPDIPIIANLGAVQLNNGYGMEECKRIVELAEADALVLHLNSLQEVIQPEGNTNFRGLLKKIEELCHQFQLPVGVKEVGWGINGELAKKLFNVGVSFVDVAGAGGTSWSQVEKLRSTDPVKTAMAEVICNWGIPTSECLLDIKKHHAEGFLIASGGLLNGAEAAKAIALGADLAGFGRTILPQAVQSAESLIEKFTLIESELRVIMFGIGAETIESLKNTKRLERLFF